MSRPLLAYLATELLIGLVALVVLVMTCREYLGTGRPVLTPLGRRALSRVLGPLVPLVTALVISSAPRWQRGRRAVATAFARARLLTARARLLALRAGRFAVATGHRAGRITGALRTSTRTTQQAAAALPSPADRRSARPAARMTAAARPRSHRTAGASPVRRPSRRTTGPRRPPSARPDTRPARTRGPGGATRSVTARPLGAGSSRRRR